MAAYKDIVYDVGENAVRIMINRPDVMNAFRLQTVEELIDAFQKANEERSVNTVVFAGAGEKASVRVGIKRRICPRTGCTVRAARSACPSRNCKRRSAIFARCRLPESRASRSAAATYLRRCAI